MSAPTIELIDNTLTRGGLFYELQEKLRLINVDDQRVHVRAIIFGAAAFGPLLVLAAVQGVAWNADVSRSLLHDPTVYGRFLIAIPFFILAENLIDDRYVVITSYFKNSGIIPPSEMDAYVGILASLRNIIAARKAELIILIAAFAVSTISAVINLQLGEPSWRSNADGSFTLAMWWLLLFSLPLFNFLLLRWIWRFFIWISFLWRLAKLKLHLIPTHPDGAGGLGVLAESTHAYAPIFLGISAVVASVWAKRVVMGEASVADYYTPFVALVVVAVIISAFPLLLFARRLLKLKLLGLHDYGVMANLHSLYFDNKWIKDAEENMPDVLGAPDISSLTDLAASYQVVQGMWFLPFRLQNIIVVVASVAIPMVPLLLLEIPLKDLLLKIGGALL